MHRLAQYWLIAVALAVPAPARAVSPDPATLAVPADQVSRARELIRQLGSASFRERDRATRELRKMGRLALAALAERQGDPDPEVRMRVGAILPRAAADDLRAKVGAFLADAAGRYTHDLPGWSRFRALAGGDRATRDLFAEVVRDKENHEILVALRGVPADRAAGLAALAGAVTESAADRPPVAELLRALDARRQGVQARVNPVVPAGVRRVVAPDLPAVALLLVADSLVSEKGHSRTQFQYQLINYLHTPSVRDASAGNGKYGPAFRPLVRHWLESRDGPIGLASALSLVRTLRFEAGVATRLAARVLRAAGAQPYTRAQAAAILAQYGDRSQLFRITELFRDEAILVRGGPNMPHPNILVRDTALAMAVLLSGQNTAQYGFSEHYPNNESLKFNYINFRFREAGTGTTEEKRAAAFAKWKTWEGGLHGSLAGPAGAALVLRKYPAMDHAK